MLFKQKKETDPNGTRDPLPLNGKSHEKCPYFFWTTSLTFSDTHFHIDSAIETNTKYGKKGKTFPRFIRGQMSLCGRRSKYQINEFLRARN